MSVAVSNVVERAAELRRDFDRGFAEPIRLDPIATEDLLAIRIGGQPHAIRLAEIAGLFAGKKITRVPGGHPALSGIAAFRGALLPVYDLALVLGHAGAQAPRWMVIVAALPVALAFDGFEGQFRVPRTDILPQAAHADAPAHAQLAFGIALLAVAVGSRQRQDHLRHSERPAFGGAVEDDVVHFFAAQHLGALLAEGPGDGVADVGLSAAVGADDGRHGAWKGQIHLLEERLEAGDLDAFESQHLARNVANGAGRFHKLLGSGPLPPQQPVSGRPAC